MVNNKQKVKARCDDYKILRGIDKILNVRAHTGPEKCAYCGFLHKPNGGK